MGREIRKVPANWVHPTIERSGRIDKQPMYDQRFEDRFSEWLADFDRVRSGKLSDIEKGCYPRGIADWLQDETPPDPAYYRPWGDEAATWFQVWETVSEGTPVTQPFESQSELVDYLVRNGDEWDQKRGDGGWSRPSAESFVNAGWAPSFVVLSTASSVEIHAPRDGAI